MEYIGLVLLLGAFALWGIHQHQERLIARRGYTWYIGYSARWKKKRRACYKRFGYRCAVCNSPRDLQAHHRTYRNLFNERPEDLTCLCAVCHSTAPKSAGLYKG
jgi:5-methylcytosine-specific restriction endonuclease McrA